jgi:hypothetical protein
MGQNQIRRAVVAGVDGSECSLQAVRWAAAEAVRRQLPLRLVAAHAWPSGGLIGDPGLGVDYRAVLRDVVLGHLATAAAGARSRRNSRSIRWRSPATRCRCCWASRPARRSSSWVTGAWVASRACSSARWQSR